MRVKETNMSPEIQAAARAQTVNGVLSMIDSAPGNKVMLVIDGRVVTYGWMLEQSLRVAGRLHLAGVDRHDRVAVWLPNSVAWFVAMLACARLGACLVSLNIRLGAKEVGSLISRTECKALVMDPAYRDGSCVRALRSIDRGDLSCLNLLVTDEVAEAILPDLQQTSLEALGAIGDVDAVLSAAERDPCLIVATSGTTSSPKLVEHAQGSVFRHSKDVARAAGLDAPESTLLLALPLSGAFGYTAALAALSAHCPIHLFEGFEAEQVAGHLRENGITHMLGTNDMLNKILDASPGDQPFPRLKLFGHANFDPSLTKLPQRAEAAGVLIRGFYGMSELLAGFATQSPDAPVARRAEAGGFPVCEEAQFRIANPDTGSVLAVEQEGELQVLTPNRMTGYLNNVKATEDAFTSDGYFRTGDLAYLNKDGGFTFVSRINDVLRIGGYLVSPVEIEDVVSKLTNAHTCQAVAVAVGQSVRPVAFVVLRSGQVLDEAATIELCKAQLAIYKTPIRVFAVDEIPMVNGPNGQKVNRVALRELAQSLIESTSEAKQ